MGQSYSLTTPYAGSAGIDVPQLADLVHEKSIGSARFMKSIRARSHDGVVLVKVTVKPHNPMSLSEYGHKIQRERDKLRDVPNALPFERVFETDTNAYLIRQYLYSSLYDRLSTRPFLEDIEKKWIAFQVLCALRDCHARDVYHGDLKTENVLVTSWNWVYLSDFSGTFKPSRLPDNNPALYSYFFDLSGRRTCYIAPERFLAPGEEHLETGSITWAMDVFSAGCVIAELFLETPIFTLSQLFKYRRGEFDPLISHLSRIPDLALREMLSSMISLNPEKRYSAEQYLDIYKGKIFPEYFYHFLHQYMELITDPSSGRAPISGEARNLGEADERIDRVFYDFDKIAYFLGYSDITDNPQTSQTLAPRLGLGLFPLRLNIPNNEHYASTALQPPADDGTLIFLTLVASSLRNTARAASKIRACDILLAFSERLTDEAKLDRVLPYLMTLLNDDVDLVAIAALRSVTQLVAMIRVVTPVNAHVFPEYIMPRLQVFLAGVSRTLVLGKERREPSRLVRATYATCLGNLATTASRFLEMTAILRAEGSIMTTDPEIEAGNGALSALDNLFDNTQSELVDVFEMHAKALVEDQDVSVRRAFLSSVPELCMFFGSAESNDILLTHLNTYLNDRDWMLKCAFFDTVVGIATFLGSTSLEEFNLPLMVQALTDPEEHVVHAALHSLAELANLGLLSKPKTWELVDVVARFTMHPNIWIREASVEFLSKATRLLSPADVRCLVLPHVKPFLRGAIIPNFSELALLDALRKPLSRTVFDQALVWAQKADRGLFWSAVQKQKQSTFNLSSAGMATRAPRDSQPLSMSKVSRNEEDEQWLSRLRTYGMSPEDDFKLLVLREFIWRLSQMKSRESAAFEGTAQGLSPVVVLRNIRTIRIQTIMFDETVVPDEAMLGGGIPADSDKGHYTIADALLDASMTIDEPAGRRRRAAINTHRARLSSQGSAVSPRNSVGKIFLSPTQTQPSTPTDGRAENDDSRRASSSTRGRPSVRDEEAATQQRPFSARRAIRNQTSALDLLRKDSNRSIPETGTTETNAFGEVDGPFSQNPPPKITLPGTIEEDMENETKQKAAHSYEGNDPNVLKMLDSMFLDNYPHDKEEFGPLVTPVTRRRATKASSGQSDDPWRPSGRLVATFSEHTGPVNCIVPSPDHVFFVTGGDDGAVKVWDSSRLERNVSHRARQTHKHAAGAKVVAICFIENTHCFVSCATDGSVHIVKVETATSGNSVKYVRLRVLHEYRLPANEYAVCCAHFKLELPSVLLLATTRSRILGIDLRTMTPMYSLDNPVHHGTPTCFVVDRKRHWVLLGTSHGILDLWDLRFKLRLKGWGLPGKAPVHRLALHPSKGRGKWVCVAGGTGLNEVTVWDLEKTQCREIYRASGLSSKEGPREYKAWDVDDDKPEGMLSRFATNIEPSGVSPADRCIKAMTVGSGAMEDHRDLRFGYMITGGADKKLRFWDLNRIEQSTMYSGLLGEDAKPVFSTQNSPNSPGLVLNVERVPKSASSAKDARDEQQQPKDGRNGEPTSSARRSREKPPRHTVISAEQGQLLRSHLDLITDVTVLEVPYTMAVSVDRSGVIFVFQ